jgi:hypothetical protein
MQWLDKRCMHRETAKIDRWVIADVVGTLVGVPVRTNATVERCRSEEPLIPKRGDACCRLPVGRFDHD